MERKQITAFLSEQLIQDKLTGNGKYWAREVCLSGRWQSGNGTSGRR